MNFMGRSLSKKALKKVIWAKTGGVCAHCGKTATGKAATIDHFIPVVMGGTYDQRNLMPLCVKCNKLRGSLVVDPACYYQYASEWDVNECLSYKSEWRVSRTNLDNELL